MDRRGLAEDDTEVDGGDGLGMRQPHVRERRACLFQPILRIHNRAPHARVEEIFEVLA